MLRQGEKLDLTRHATATALSTMLASSGASNARCSNDQGIDVADADGHPDRTVVGPLHSRPHQGSRVEGHIGKSHTHRQAAVALGATPLFRAYQCGRQSGDLRTAGAHS